MGVVKMREEDGVGMISLTTTPKGSSQITSVFGSSVICIRRGVGFSIEIDRDFVLGLSLRNASLFFFPSKDLLAFTSLCSLW